MNREQHPVWNVYDGLRTVRLNSKYYACRLQSAERWNFWLEFLLAATAPTSAIAGLWFWSSSVGHALWKYLGIIAAVAAVMKPLLHLTSKIKGYESALTIYRAVEFDLREIKAQIDQQQKYGASQQAAFSKANALLKGIIAKPPETREHLRTKLRCETEVDAELPHEYFFVPKE